MRSLLIITLAITIFSCYATPKRVLPIFNNFWYVQATDSDKSNDICDPDRTTYYYQHVYTSLVSMESYLRSQLPNHPNCTWGPLITKSSTYNMPIDFPGDDNDYDELSKSSPKTIDWATDCRT